jgi:NADH-quinone oxidoreductase subunit A
MPAENLIIFFVAGALMVGGGMLVSHWLAPKSKNPQKAETYECGIPTEGASWMQFKAGYYLFAILFLIFEIETVFVFLWALTMKENGLVAFIEILIFFFILGAGLLYAWKKGALKWD